MSATSINIADGFTGAAEAALVAFEDARSARSVDWVALRRTLEPFRAGLSWGRRVDHDAATEELHESLIHFIRADRDFRHQQELCAVLKTIPLESDYTALYRSQQAVHLREREEVARFLLASLELPVIRAACGPVQHLLAAQSESVARSEWKRRLRKATGARQKAFQKQAPDALPRLQKHCARLSGLLSCLQPGRCSPRSRLNQMMVRARKDVAAAAGAARLQESLESFVKICPFKGRKALSEEVARQMTDLRETARQSAATALNAWMALEI